MRFFILGNHPTLSVAEIAALFPEASDFSLSSEETCLLDVPSDSSRVSRLGGIIKSGEILAETGLDTPEELGDLLEQAILAKTIDGRTVFGISVHSLAPGAPIKPIVAKTKALGLGIKKRLKNNGKSARLVTSTTPALPSVAIQTNHLLASGGEFVILVTNQKIYLGETDHVQDFSAWSDRDYGRPARDTKSGMLPPKLARMMVNLTAADPSKDHLADPFCGSGTILMEAVLSGFSRISGSDISEKAIKDSKTNLEWLAARAGLGLTLPTLEVADVRTLQETFGQVDTIATETYLGPVSRNIGIPTPRAREDLMKLFSDAFTRLFQALKPGGRAVVAFPCWRDQQSFIYLPLKQELARIGFSVLPPLPASVPKFLSNLTPSGGLLYARPDAAVGREILILRRP